MEKNLFGQLSELAGEENVFCDEPMKKHITFRVGGKADYFVKAQSREILAQLISFLRAEKVPFFVMGNGSNLLFTDEGYRGVVIKVSRFPEDLKAEGEYLTAGAGVLLSQAANAACEAGLSGMEFAAGIPGTVGGAVVMNAGAYGGEIKDIIESAEAVDEQGNLIILTKEELNLSYRHSIAAERALFFTKAVFHLNKGNQEEIRTRMDELAEKRREKQPLEYPSAGSTFKRPEGFFAAKLIEDAGLKGFSIGGASVSAKHSGFVINENQALAADVFAVVEEVQKQVWEKFQVKLELEVKVVS